MVRGSLLLAGVLTGIGSWGCQSREDEETTLPVSAAPEVFGIPSRQDVAGVSGNFDRFLPPGIGELKLGDSRAGVKEQRGLYYAGKPMAGPDGSSIELHGSGTGSYAERVRRGSSVPLDRVEVSFNREDRLSGLQLNTEYGAITREVILDLSSLLVEVFGQPDHVFDVRQREIVGMQWVAPEGRVRLWFREPRGGNVRAYLQVEDPQEMMTDTALNLDVALAKEGAAGEVAAFLKPFMEEALVEEVE